MSRFLVDENLSPALANALRNDGHDARHVNAVGLSGTPDQTIMAWAAGEGRTVITADHDFHDELFTTGAAAPSVIRLSQRGPDALAGTHVQSDRLRTLLPGLEPYLATGIAVAVDRSRLSVTPLPLGRKLQRLPTAHERAPGREPNPTPARTVGGRAASTEPVATRVMERVRERRLTIPDQSRSR